MQYVTPKHIAIFLLGGFSVLAYLFGGAFVDYGMDHIWSTSNNTSTTVKVIASTTNTTDVNLTAALKLEKSANASINASSEALKWATMGDGNYDAAQTILENNKATENVVAWAGNNLTKTPTSARGKEYAKLYLVLENDSQRLHKINEDALRVSKPKFDDLKSPANTSVPATSNGTGINTTTSAPVASSTPVADTPSSAPSVQEGVVAPEEVSV